MTIADTLRHLNLSAPDPRSDGELVRVFVAVRDEAAFAELLRRHGPTVYGVCHRVVGPADADDTFQAVFLVLARKAGTVRPPGMVGNWLYGVAVRTANKVRVMNARKANRRRESPGGLDQHPAVHTACSPDRDTLAVIDAELASLPDVYRAAFVTCELNGRSRSEASRELGWPEGTVAARLAKARELLAGRLRKRGVTLGVGLFAAVAVPAVTAGETLSAVRELLAIGTASAVAPAAQTLSDEVTKSMTAMHMKWVLLAGLVLTLATGGAVLLAAPGDKPVREQIKAPVPKELKPMEWKEAEPIEFTDGGRITSVAFAPSGKTFAVCRADGKIDFFDPVTRKHQQSMNFLGDPKSNPKREGGTVPAIAFRPTPHAKLGDVFAIAHKNGVNFGTTNIGLMLDEPEAAVEGIPPNWELKGVNPHGVSWPVDGEVIATNGGDLWWRGLRGKEWLDIQRTANEQFGQRVLLPRLSGDDDRYLCGWARDKGEHGVELSPPPVQSSLPLHLAGHRAAVIAAASSAAGNRLLTADTGGTLIVWDGQKHEFKESRRVELGEGVQQLSLAPDGKTVAVVRAYTDTTLLGTSGRTLFNLELFVFDVTDPPQKPKPLWSARNVLADKKEFTSPVSLAFSPDGTTLLAAFADPYTDNPKERGAVPKSMGVKVWTLGGQKAKAPEAEWKEGEPIELPGYPVQNLAVSPDGKTLAAVIGRGSVSLHDPDTGARVDKNFLPQLKANATRLDVSFSPEGKLAITGQNGVVAFDADTLRKDFATAYRRWDLWEGIPNFDPHRVVWLHEERTGGGWAAGEGRLVATDGVSFKEVGWTRGKKEGEDLVRATGETWEVKKGEKHAPTVLAAAPDVRRVFHSAGPAEGKGDPQFDLFVREAAKQPHTVHTLSGHKARPTSGAISADGRLMVSGDEAGTVVAWDGEKFGELGRWKLGGEITNVAVAADNRTAAVFRVKETTDGEAKTEWELYVFDVTTAPVAIAPVWRATLPGLYSKSEYRLPDHNGNRDAGPYRAALAFYPTGKKLYGALGFPYLKTRKDDPDQPPRGIRVWELVPKK
jgi:RNA polymerase sigma factor (sigma-70 family)